MISSYDPSDTTKAQRRCYFPSIEIKFPDGISSTKERTEHAVKISSRYYSRRCYSSEEIVGLSKKTSNALSCLESVETFTSIPAAINTEVQSYTVDDCHLTKSPDTIDPIRQRIFCCCCDKEVGINCASFECSTHESLCHFHCSLQTGENIICKRKISEISK
jgi:hypothetical protein